MMMLVMMMIVLKEDRSVAYKVRLFLEIVFIIRADNKRLRYGSQKQVAINN